jgi:autotransporter-associated beta strand protein
MSLSSWFRPFAYVSALVLATISAGILSQQAHAATQFYFDVNGATAGSGVTSGGSYTWEGNNWSNNNNGAVTTGPWVDPVTDDATDGFARFAASSDAAANNYSVTANSNHLIVGMFLKSNGGGTVTVNGPGVLSIGTNGGPVQGFLVNSSSQVLIINAKLSGAGGVENELSGSLDLYGDNDYSGGTVLGTSAGLNFNNNHSFGTGPISWGVTQQVIADPTAAGPLTIANTMTTRAASQLIVVTPATAPVTFSGDWTLAAGNSQLTMNSATTKMIISGNIGGAGSNIIKDGVGTLVISGPSNTYNGTTTVNAGSLVLGIANAIASSSSVTLGGGTLDPGGFNQSMAATSMALSNSSAIDYGTGASEVDFANSSAATWVAGKILNLTSWNFGTDKLRFGTDATGLTSTQLGQIEFNGAGLGTAMLDGNGFVVIPEPASILLTLIGGVMFSGWRRRKN